MHTSMGHILSGTDSQHMVELMAAQLMEQERKDRHDNCSVTSRPGGKHANDVGVCFLPRCLCESTGLAPASPAVNYPHPCLAYSNPANSNIMGTVHTAESDNIPNLLIHSALLRTNEELLERKVAAPV
jgi:hypothetical protein